MNYDAASWLRGSACGTRPHFAQKGHLVVEVPTWKSGNFKFTVQEFILNTSLILNMLNIVNRC